MINTDGRPTIACGVTRREGAELEALRKHEQVTREDLAWLLRWIAGTGKDYTLDVMDRAALRRAADYCEGIR